MSKNTKSPKQEKVFNSKLFTKRLLATLYALRFVFYTILLAAFIVVINKYWLSSDRVNHDLLIEYLETFKWLILLVIGTVIFRKHLPDLVTRAKELGPGGAKFYPPQMSPDPSNEEQLQDVTTSDPRNNIDISTESGRLVVLKDYQAKWLLEKIFRGIFGTQINALQKLHQFPDGLAEADLLNIYERHKTIGGEMAHPSLSDFMGYLTGHGLVEFNPSSRIYKLADAGRLYLEYMNQENLNSNMKSL